MTDLLTDDESFAYVLTLDGREDTRHVLTTEEFDPEDPMFDSRRDALARLRQLQAEGSDPQAWILTTEELAALDAGTLTYGQLPEYSHLPTSPSPQGPVTDQVHWTEREADRIHTYTYRPDDLSNLIHTVVRVRGTTRTIVAAFPEPVDALVWADHLTHEAATPGDRFEVPGYDITHADLEPYLPAADAGKGGCK